MKNFATRDLYLASTLVTLKFSLLGIDYQIEGDKMNPVGYFRFDDTPELQDIRLKYNQGNLLVEPKAYITALKSLKSEIINLYRNPHLSRF